jgi:hypothetical protein
VPKNRQAKMEWAEPEGEGRNWDRRNENGRQTGNQKRSTELSHGLHHGMSMTKQRLWNLKVPFIRISRPDSVKNNDADDPARGHATTDRILPDNPPNGTRQNRKTILNYIKACSNAALNAAKPEFKSPLR